MRILLAPGEDPLRGVPGLLGNSVTECEGQAWATADMFLIKGSTVSSGARPTQADNAARQAGPIAELLTGDP